MLATIGKKKYLLFKVSKNKTVYILDKFNKEVSLVSFVKKDNDKLIFEIIINNKIYSFNFKNKEKVYLMEDDKKNPTFYY